ncbi:aminoglycoside phosphotransferase family protein [Streptomyces sp. XD-27]|uniref:aminoglycoside phosphotransferase family protein n=1 Tax=Streptomyces sp. XD-27 TaxID=3062779 RepID=UPI0026F47714|nr:aminoglycoside phosphotransferase family protein [Streptomyces sp. XD-27]WKX71624.1 aminoglycoside phosphotransferase family protein [Streptomyces sp. XD-27]
MTHISLPEQFAASCEDRDDGPEWIAALPALIAEFLERWDLRPDGAPAHGMAALVLPVLRPDGTPAALKFRQVTEESVGEPVGLREWAGDGAVRLLDHDAPSGTLLLERLDIRRSLASVPDAEAALLKLAGLLARLVARPAPAGLRTLADVTDAMLTELPRALPALADPDERRLLETCAAAVREVRDEPGDRLLHWDLHYENVLASLPGSGREPWLAIDPEPLAGDPGFDLMPALDNRWDDIVATGDIARAVRRRFDLLTEVVGLDRQRAMRWTLARVLQNSLWDVEDGEDELQDTQVAIAETLLPQLT